MSKHLIMHIEQAERDYMDARYKRDRAGEYASGFCSCCGSDDGLDDGVPCGYCAEGIRLLEKR